MDEIEYTIPSPLTPYCSADRWLRIINEELELAYLEQQTAEKAAKKACKRINKLIAE